MAALAAAFELTRTQALRDRFAVTIYQMGWRLGGKAASGRDAERNYRIVEHGLHVWFGCYENAFRLLNDAYNEWDKPDGQTIRGVDAAFVPQTETIIGSGDAPGGVKMGWPKFGEPPWESSPGTRLLGLHRSAAGAHLRIVRHDSVGQRERTQILAGPVLR